MAGCAIPRRGGRLDGALYVSVSCCDTTEIVIIDGEKEHAQLYRAEGVSAMRGSRAR